MGNIVSLGFKATLTKNIICKLAERAGRKSVPPDTTTNPLDAVETERQKVGENLLGSVAGK